MRGTALLLFFFTAAFISAQKFQQKYPGYEINSGTKSAVKHRNGTFAVAATRNDTVFAGNSISRIYRRLALLKLNDTGHLTSAKIFRNDTFSIDQAHIDTLDDQTYIISCNATYLSKAWGSYQTWGSFILLYKLSSEGNVVWCKSISDCNDFSACEPYFHGGSVSSIGDGTVYLNFFSSHEQQGKLHTMRLDDNGNTRWHRVLATANFPNRIKTGINKTLWINCNYWEEGIKFLCYDTSGVLIQNFICGSQVNDFIQLPDTSLLVAAQGSMYRIDKNLNPLWVRNNYSDYGSIKLIDDSTFETGCGDHNPVRSVYNLLTGSHKKNFIYGAHPYTTIRSVKIETTNDGGRILFYNSYNGLHILKTDTDGRTGCEILIEEPSSGPVFQGNIYIKASQNSSTSHQLVIVPFQFTAGSTIASHADACCDAEVYLYSNIYGGICEGSYAYYQASGMTNYVWSNGISGQHASYKVNSDTAISVIGFNSCKTDTATIHVNPYASPTLNLVTAQDTICLGEEALLLPSGNYEDLWLQVKYTASSEKDTLFVRPDSSGTYFVFASISHNKYTNCRVRDSFFIHVNYLPEIPVLSRSGDTLFSSAPTGNQWYFNGSPIAGATNQFLVLNQHGSYYVEVTNAAGCFASSAICNCVLIGIEETVPVISDVFPNPANEFIEIIAQRELSSIKIYDLSGRVYLTISEINSAEYHAQIQHLSPGLYFIEAACVNNKSVLKFIKE